MLWRRRPQDRALLVACATAIPALWLIPELIGSGDLLRSGARARVPNPGQPATEAVPALAALREAAALPLWPLWAGAIAVLVTRRQPARALLFAGLAWIGLVAVMAQAGFSGEPRYSLPGAALVAIAGAVGLVALARTRAAAVVAGILLLVAAAPKLADLPDLRDDQAYQRDLAAGLSQVIDRAGGREALLACGRPYVGDLRGPLLAYHLDVEKQRVAFVPRPPGAAFLSRIGEERARRTDHAALVHDPGARAAVGGAHRVLGSPNASAPDRARLGRGGARGGGGGGRRPPRPAGRPRSA